MNIYIGKKKLTATMADNSSVKALIELLKKKDICLDLTDYGHFEKVGDLGHKLPTNDERITTTTGDLILYQGHNFSVYYDTNTWELTRLGKINNINQDELERILGMDDVTVRLSLK